MEDKRPEKLTVGLVDKVELLGSKGSIEVLAKFDTGAKSNSIDHTIAAKVGMGPIVSSVMVVSASGEKKRPVIEVDMKINGKEFKTKANLEDRSGMEYKVLIGRELIHSNFLIDVSKSHRNPRELSLRKRIVERTGLAPGDSIVRGEGNGDGK